MALSKAFRRVRVVALSLALWCPALMAMAQGRAASSAELPAFVVGTAATSASAVGMWQRRLYEEALRRLGWRMVVLELPALRITHMLQQGEIDADMARSPVFGTQHPELVKVPQPLVFGAFGVFSLQPEPSVSDLNALLAQDGAVAYRRGVVGCEKWFAARFPAARLNGVSKTVQGLAMLERHRVQAFCDVSNQLLDEPLAQDMLERGQLHKLFEVGAPVPLNAYLHAKHAALAPKLAATLRQMKSEGLFDRYWTARGRRPD